MKFVVGFVMSMMVSIASAAELPNPFLPPVAPPPIQQDQIQIQSPIGDANTETSEAKPKDLKTGYQVTSYSVIGTLQGGATRFVVVSAPTGQAFVLTEGDAFGEQDAVVETIGLDVVTLVIGEELVTVSVGGI